MERKKKARAKLTWEVKKRASTLGKMSENAISAKESVRAVRSAVGGYEEARDRGRVEVIYTPGFWKFVDGYV